MNILVRESTSSNLLNDFKKQKRFYATWREKHMLA